MAESVGARRSGPPGQPQSITCNPLEIRFYILVKHYQKQNEKLSNQNLLFLTLTSLEDSFAQIHCKYNNDPCDEPQVKLGYLQHYWFYRLSQDLQLDRASLQGGKRCSSSLGQIWQYFWKKKEYGKNNKTV